MIQATSREGGYALVSILWLLGLLALAVGSMSVFTVNSLSVVTTSHDRVAAEALSRAGVEAAVFELTQGPTTRVALGSSDFKAGNGAIFVAWRGEAGQVDLNVAQPELIHAVFTAIGASDIAAKNYATLVVERRIPRAGVAGQGPFGHIGELSQLGVPDALIKRAHPLLTVYNGGPRVDPRLAPREVLALLPGMTSASLLSLLSLRARPDVDLSQWLTDAGEAARYLTIERGRTARVRVEVGLINGFRSTVEVVIVIFGDDTEPYRVLAWDESPPERKLDQVDGGRL